jgi:hypothetical protein
LENGGKLALPRKNVAVGAGGDCVAAGGAGYAIMANIRVGEHLLGRMD